MVLTACGVAGVAGVVAREDPLLPHPLAAPASARRMLNRPTVEVCIVVNDSRAPNFLPRVAAPSGAVEHPSDDPHSRGCAAHTVFRSINPR